MTDPTPGSQGESSAQLKAGLVARALELRVAEVQARKARIAERRKERAAGDDGRGSEVDLENVPARARVVRTVAFTTATAALGVPPDKKERDTADKAERERYEEGVRTRASLKEELYTLLKLEATVSSEPIAWRHTDGIDRDDATISLLDSNQIENDMTLAEWLRGRSMDDFIVNEISASKLSFSVYFPSSTTRHVSGYMVRTGYGTGPAFVVKHIGPGVVQ